MSATVVEKEVDVLEILEEDDEFEVSQSYSLRMSTTAHFCHYIYLLGIRRL